VDHESNSIDQISFVVDKPYLSVVKNLSKKDSLEGIVRENDATLIEKSWENFNIDVPRRVLRVKDYKISGILYFKIEKNDSFLGKMVIPFVQTVNFDRNTLKIDIKLREIQKNLIFYEKNIKITPISDENKTFVEIKSELTVKNKIPFFFKDFMDKKVTENNKNDIKKLESNLKYTTNQVKLTINYENWRFE
jgi:hypothetical protein